MTKKKTEGRSGVTKKKTEKVADRKALSQPELKALKAKHEQEVRDVDALILRDGYCFVVENGLTYTARFQVEVGDVVLLPNTQFWSEDKTPYRSKMVRLGSTYKGELVYAIRNDGPEVAAEKKA